MIELVARAIESVDLSECAEATSSVAKELEAKNDPRARPVARAAGLLFTLAGALRVVSALGTGSKPWQTPRP